MKKNNNQYFIITVGLCLLMCFNGFNIASAQSVTDEKKWNFLAEVYMLFPNMNGETGIGNNLTVPVDASTRDIFSTLKLGGMLYLEAHTKKWAITSDFVFMNLEKDILPTTFIQSGSVGVDQYIWETAGLYRINHFLELGVGGRLNHLAADMAGERNGFPNEVEAFSESQSKSFFDPVLITRLSTDIDGKWLFQFRGDLGGFGVGSDFTWQLQACAGYRFTKVFQLTGGYRILGIDYDKGVDKERFIFNMNEFGPVVRLGFNL